MPLPTIGSRRARYGNPARQLGHLWRDQQKHPYSTAERLFDPREANPIHKALANLQQLKGPFPVGNILVVDGYSLDRDALEAIVAIAVAHSPDVTVDIVTKFDEKPGGASPPIAQRIADFKALAKAVSQRFGIHIRLHKIDGINVHDRFLMIDERMWHIGPSFNAVGEALSGLVEMRDLTVKAALLDMIEPLIANPIFDSSAP